MSKSFQTQLAVVHRRADRISLIISGVATVVSGIATVVGGFKEVVDGLSPSETESNKED